MEECPLAKQQLHHLGVALPGGQVERRQALLVALVQQAGVGDGLQQAVARVDAAVPLQKNKQTNAQSRSVKLWRKEAEACGQSGRIPSFCSKAIGIPAVGLQPVIY